MTERLLHFSTPFQASVWKLKSLWKKFVIALSWLVMKCIIALLIPLDSAEVPRVNWTAEIPLSALQIFPSVFKWGTAQKEESTACTESSRSHRLPFALTIWSSTKMPKLRHCHPSDIKLITHAEPVREMLFKNACTPCPPNIGADYSFFFFLHGYW